MGIFVVESNPEGGVVGGELSVGAVEEEVVLIVGFDVVRGEEVGEFVVRGRVGETEFDFDLHWWRWLLICGAEVVEEAAIAAKMEGGVAGIRKQSETHF